MIEVYPKPGAAAIIEKIINGEKHILIQTRQKPNGGSTNGLLEIPAGKIREYENVYDALRREIMEETGLTVTEISGESDVCIIEAAQGVIMSFEPFCVTQNLSGIYSIILHTFLCKAIGAFLEKSEEATEIRWVKVSDIERTLITNQDNIFPMHIPALHKYLSQ